MKSFLRRDVLADILDAEDVGKISSLVGFVEHFFIFREADRKRFFRFHQGCDQAGIDTARKEGACLHITDFVGTDGICHCRFDFFHIALQSAIFGMEFFVPIFDRMDIVAFQHHIMRRFQFVDAFEEGFAHRRVLQRQIRAQSIFVHFFDESRVSQK